MKLTERQKNLREWKEKKLCLSCGDPRGRFKDGGFCTPCADSMTRKYFDRLESLKKESA